MEVQTLAGLTILFYGGLRDGCLFVGGDAHVAPNPEKMDFLCQTIHLPNSKQRIHVGATRASLPTASIQYTDKPQCNNSAAFSNLGLSVGLLTETRIKPLCTRTPSPACGRELPPGGSLRSAGQNHLSGNEFPRGKAKGSLLEGAPAKRVGELSQEARNSFLSNL